LEWNASGCQADVDEAQEQGLAVETRVLKEMHCHGWHLLDRNWSCRWGGLDLLVIKGLQLLLIEFKRRRAPL
tara:strand:- start:629 stop:844 length:216 start_codon:yes stop_codon:yes gene_type:complete